MSANVRLTPHAGLLGSAAHADLRRGIIYIDRVTEKTRNWEDTILRVLVHETLHLVLFRVADGWKTGDKSASAGLDYLDGGWGFNPKEGREARITGDMAGVPRLARLPVLAAPQREKTAATPRPCRPDRQVRLESCRFLGCGCSG
jgi:hypothetical protein